jgi:hypothetical protein
MYNYIILTMQPHSPILEICIVSQFIRIGIRPSPQTAGKSAKVDKPESPP